MQTAARPGESAGCRRRAFPDHRILARIACACLLFAAGLWLPAAHAGALYRCTGAGGETVFSSSTAGYSNCRKLGSYPGAAPKAARRTAARPRASLAGVTGSVQTTAQRVSLAGLETAVDTTARVLPPGRWSYREDPPTVATAGQAPAPVADTVRRGAVYRVVQADGSVEYTNIRPGGGRGRAVTMLFTYIATCVACNLHSTIDWNRVPLHLTSFAAAIRAASLESGVDEAFLRAIIHAESAFNPNALSLKGAQGLMQLMPGTASDMGVLDAFDAGQNIRGGARYLGQLLRAFGGDEQLAAAAYNAGPGAVRRYDGVPPYAETRVYVKRVAELRKRYGAAVHGPVTAMRNAP